MNDITNKRIALIGGAGFIGHNLALALKKAGACVEIIDSLQVNNLLSFASSSYKEENRELYTRIVNQRLDLLRKEDIPIEVQDAREYHVLSRLLDRIKPEVIIHLAAVAHAGRSNKDPYSTFDHSFRTLENTLDYARGRVKQFIYFSSSMVYGHFESGLVTEEAICNPIGIYGALKYSGEKIVIAYSQVFGLPYTIVRPSALYGERCVSRRVGQIFIENALRDMDISINGDGSDRLDFTYIDDLTQGIINVLESENSKGQIFNLTYGKSRSISDLTTILAGHFPQRKINYLPKDKLMPDRGTLSIEKAKNLIGYNPQYSLEKGFAKYIEWYKKICSQKPL
jgi:nucleoside-diphosphate-sugar epimerase